MCVYIYIYIYTHLYVCVAAWLVSTASPTAGRGRGRRPASAGWRQYLYSPGFHDFNLRISNLRVSNPNKLIVDVFLTRCRISMCQSLGPKKHDEIYEIDSLYRYIYTQYGIQYYIYIYIYNMYTISYIYIYMYLYNYGDIIYYDITYCYIVLCHITQYVYTYVNIYMYIYIYTYTYKARILPALITSLIIMILIWYDML